MTDANPLAQLLSGDGLTSRAKKYVTAFVVGEAVIEVTKRLHRAGRATFVHTISVPSGDDVYDLLHERVFELMPERGRRSMIVRSMRPRFVQNEAPSPAGSPSRLVSLYDGSREQSVVIDGHRVRIRIEREDTGITVLSALDAGEHGRMRERVVLTAYSRAGRDAVLALLAELSSRVNRSDSPRFFIAAPWGEWIRRDDLEARALSTIILRRGQKERLVADLEKFLASRTEYGRLGIPWHRGYLLHGPPGTGKTSLARALATHFALDVYCLPLAGIEDGRLLRLVGVVPAGSMLLLEDIDILHAARDRTAEMDVSGASLTGLLNALDGVSTPPGLVSILTTNEPDALDDALVRKGRIDVSEQIPNLDDLQLGDLVRTHLGEDVEMPAIGERVISPADVAEELKRHMGDRDGQIDALQQLLYVEPDPVPTSRRRGWRAR